MLCILFWGFYFLIILRSNFCKNRWQVWQNIPVLSSRFKVSCTSNVCVLLLRGKDAWDPSSFLEDSDRKTTLLSRRWLTYNNFSTHQLLSSAVTIRPATFKQLGRFQLVLASITSTAGWYQLSWEIVITRINVRKIINEEVAILESRMRKLILISVCFYLYFRKFLQVLIWRLDCIVHIGNIYK